MDINCISNCAHQTEGKCTLTELPARPRMTAEAISLGGDTSCPYFARKGKKPYGE